jgi:hypothetical protein
MSLSSGMKALFIIALGCALELHAQAQLDTNLMREMKAWRN